MVDLRKLSFGGPAAIVTSMAIIVGLDSAVATKATVVTGLLIIGIGDNLTDSLCVHIYQESERTTERLAFGTTTANFLTRLVLTLSFVTLFLFLPTPISIYISIVWGFVLLAGLSYLLARARGASVISEIWKHSAVAIVVIFLSKILGVWIPFLMSFA
jgi:vacuolar iron transporter family protein